MGLGIFFSLTIFFCVCFGPIIGRYAMYIDSIAKKLNGSVFVESCQIGILFEKYT